ncbi:MAG: hypothetical protein J1F65_06640, partial [Clostridiales bacterium]|nr:hypothetical protein [Clostridiales bacterium]
RKKVKLNVDVNVCVLKPLAAGLLMTLFVTVALTLLDNFFQGTLGTLLMIAIAGGIYFAALFALKVFDKSELAFLPIKQQKQQ